MTLILFVLYTGIFVLSCFLPGKDIHVVVGTLTGISLLYECIRISFLSSSLGYVWRRYLRLILCLTPSLLYVIFPLRVASAVCFSMVAGYYYLFPTLRLITLRAKCLGKLKKICRKKGYTQKRTKGLLTIRTQERVYLLRVIGSLRRVGQVSLTNATHYKIRRLHPDLGDTSDRSTRVCKYIQGPDLWGKIYRLLAIGPYRNRRMTWPATDGGTPADTTADTACVLLFLPRLCAWKFDDGKQLYVNGSVSYGVTLFDADAFCEHLS